jgi:hypothetical protein
MRTPAEKGECAAKLAAARTPSKQGIMGETDAYAPGTPAGCPSGPLFDLGRLWCGAGADILPIPSQETGLRIHFSASSHFDGSFRPLLNGSTTPLPPYLLLVL